ncbi:MAG: ribosome maturation factor RimM [Dehalococcoidia bacterium]|jgi:16S rRNA processing protein RimM|nr:ribosome maturation factor RimM [Dehalococcoidia bacterium]|tara:strand:+ start:4166 stop:4711 length:546 start_codon:yes stop_codon:yes gene_type:complete
MTGSFKPSDYLDESLVAAGRIRRPTGISGTVLVEVYSNTTNRFRVGDVVSINGAEHTITETGVSGKAIKLTFESVDSIEKANLLRGLELSVTAESLPKNPPGVYYHYEILGIDVTTLDGKPLGSITEIIETGSNDVFVITPTHDEQQRRPPDILIPVIDGVIIEVNKTSGVMVIDPPSGLL